MTKRKYFYLCACGCGQPSNDLDKNSYVRLQEGERWLAKGCNLENAVIVLDDFQGGQLVKQSDY